MRVAYLLLVFAAVADGEFANYVFVRGCAHACCVQAWFCITCNGYNNMY